MKEQMSETYEELIAGNVTAISKKIESLPIDEACEVFYLLKAERASEVFPYLSKETQKSLILHFKNDFVGKLVEYLFTDDIQELLEEDEAVYSKILENASPLKRRQLKVQATFKENSAGALMSMDFVEISEDDTAFIAMNKIKSQEKIAEIISYCYVTNEQHHLIGTISMREILVAPENAIIKDLMNTDIISVDIDDDQEIVSNQISKYDLEAIPVVDKQHRILGIITIDDILDIIEQETTEDIQRMGGITPTEGSYLMMPIKEIVKSRIVWLLILLVSATFSGAIISANDHISVKLPTLLIFMPMLMGTAGNAGSQSSAMVIRGIIVDNLAINHFYTILKKELINSMILGFILCVVNVLRIVIFMPNIEIGIALLVSITIWIIVIIANLIGGLLPLIATQLKIDPTSMSGPVLTTLCDAISLIIYFALATLYLGGML